MMNINVNVQYALNIVARLWTEKLQSANKSNAKRNSVPVLGNRATSPFSPIAISKHYFAHAPSAEMHPSLLHSHSSPQLPKMDAVKVTQNRKMSGMHLRDLQKSSIASIAEEEEVVIAIDLPTIEDSEINLDCNRDSGRGSYTFSES